MVHDSNFVVGRLGTGCVLVYETESNEISLVTWVMSYLWKVLNVERNAGGIVYVIRPVCHCSSDKLAEILRSFSEPFSPTACFFIDGLLQRRMDNDGREREKLFIANLGVGNFLGK